MSHVDLDVVPTSAPSEVEENAVDNAFLQSDYTIESIQNDFLDTGLSYIQKQVLNEGLNIFQNADDNATWKDEPLYIPDSEADEWEKTHPLEQIRWTIGKNKDCNGHYINVVKALKWWRKEKYPDVKHPKSYPLEHFIGDCCPDGIESVAEGVTLTLEKIVSDYTGKPFLPDRGVSEHDVFARLTHDDYSEFYDTVKEAAIIARNAFDASTVEEAANEWRNLFGSEFPEPPKRSSSNKFTERKEVSAGLAGGRFA